jgi:hypothetical protein
MSSFSHLIKKYQFGAKVRGHEWSLTDEQAIELFKSNCEYCGSEPSNGFNKYIHQAERYTEDTIAKNWIHYTGIDRVDNDKGYYLLNCIPCCKICNRAKHTLTIEEFETWIDRLINHRQRK